MNRNKEGETGRSECEVTKTRYLEAEELREIWDLSWKSSFQNKLGHVVCILLPSVLRSLLTSLSFFFSRVHSDPSRCLSLLLLPVGSDTLPSSSAQSEKFYSLKKTLLAAYKMIYYLLLFQNGKQFVI